MKARYILSAALFAVIGFSLLASLSFSQSRGGPQADQAIEDDPLDHPLPPGIRLRAFIHTPRVVEPNHLGTCHLDDPATNDTTYGLTGWHLPSGGIKWRLNESTVPSSVGASNARSTIAAAFNTWHLADGQKTFIEDPTTTTVKAAKFDGVNAILWKSLSPSTIGVTYVWYYTSTGLVAEVDTIFNSRYPWRVFSAMDGCSTQYDAYDLQNIAVHEFGHWVGLDDRYNSDEADLTMHGYGAGGELKKRSLAIGDITGANAVAP